MAKRVHVLRGCEQRLHSRLGQGMAAYPGARLWLPILLGAALSRHIGWLARFLRILPGPARVRDHI